MPLSIEDARRQSVSALVDGELTPAELDVLLGDGANPDAWHGDWMSFHLIGDVLRRSEPVLPSRLSPDFAVRVPQRLQCDTEILPLGTEASIQPLRVPANDAVFRWKLVAGLASLAAVAAVGWALVAVKPSSVAGSQLALVSPPAKRVDQDLVPQAVVVQTQQGQVLRDVRLEQLLADHRQFGGMSALQTPAGFLRNATYDAPPPR